MATPGKENYPIIIKYQAPDLTSVTLRFLAPESIL